MTLYHLPHHPSLSSLNPLGIRSDGEETVSHSEILRELIVLANKDLNQLEDAGETGRAWIERLERLLQDIAHGLHGDHGFNTDELKRDCPGVETTVQWRRDFRTALVKSALQLEALFSNGSILQLSQEHAEISFSPAQMDALLAHMLLGTLQIPPGNTWGRPGFTQYYDGRLVPAVRNTSLPYMGTVMAHFADGGYGAAIDDSFRFTFYYSNASQMPSPSSSNDTAPKLPVKLVNRPTDPSARQDAFVLVAANAQPGPGAAGTHEERLVGQSPALAVACILTPRLDPDAAVITSPLPVHARWEGHGWDSKLVELVAAKDRVSRRYIIADAIRMYASDKHESMRQKNADREICKLWAAFNGCRQVWVGENNSLDQLKIEMPPWGCGAFGGSLMMKMPCMMIAAGLAGLRSDNLELLVPCEQEQTVWRGPKKTLTVKELYNQSTGKQSLLASVRGIFAAS